MTKSVNELRRRLQGSARLRLGLLNIQKTENVAPDNGPAQPAPDTLTCHASPQLINGNHASVSPAKPASGHGNYAFDTPTQGSLGLQMEPSINLGKFSSSF